MTKKITARCYRIVLYKRFFDTGLGLTSYGKYILVAFGFASRNVKLTLWIGLIYAIGCFFLGRWWHKYGYENMSRKVENSFNPEITEEETPKEYKDKVMAGQVDVTP